MGSSQSRPRDNAQQPQDIIRGPLPPQKQAPIQGSSPRPTWPANLQITTSRPLRGSEVNLPTISVPSTAFLSHPSFTFGACSAGAGLFFGAGLGIFQGRHPIITTIATTIQWGVVGTCFSGVRSLALDSRDDTPAARYSATVLGSVVASATGTALGGRGRFLPKTAAAGFLGLGGQWIWDRRAERRRERQLSDVEPQSWVEWAFTRKYSPMKLLSDEEYKELLETKLLKVEAEIAVLEDDIEVIKKNAEQAKATKESRND